MAYKIRRDEDGNPLALVLIGFGNAECEYRPGDEEFKKELDASGLLFEGAAVEKRTIPPLVKPLTEEEIMWVREQVKK